MVLDHVLWLGGGCGAGKSTLARRLAYRYDLRFYPVDAYGFAHDGRATPAAQPVMTYLAGLDFFHRQVAPTVEQRVDQFIGYARERFDLIVDDLGRLDDGPLVLAEGPFLLPELVRPAMASAGHAVWLLPTADFAARNLGIRNEPLPTTDVDDQARAQSLRRQRDVELTALIRRDTARLGLDAIDVDGSLGLDETEQVLADYFEPVLNAGPRLRDGGQRTAMRREENAVVNRQVDSFVEYLGDNAPLDLPPFPYACECPTLGCTAVVPLRPADYRSAGQARAH